MPDLKALLRDRVKKTSDMLKKEVKKESAGNQKLLKSLTKPKD